MILVQDTPFDPGAEINRFLSQNQKAGAVATFIGQVRDYIGVPENDSTRITSLELEHYDGMTEKELGRIADEARTRWPLEDVLVIHRHGKMEPGEAIVLVCTASAHRADAFSACEFLMDWLKTKAPFWKREQTEASVSWVNAAESDDIRAARWAEEKD